MTALRAVVLDLDDTLFDDAGASRAGLAALAAAHGLTHWTPDEWMARQAGHIQAINPLLFGGALDAHGARVLRFSRLLADAGVPGPDGEAAAALYRTAYRASWALLDGAAEVLGALRTAGLRLAVLTNFVREVQAEKLAHFGLDALVDAVLCLEDVPAPKPDPRAYHAACAALGTLPGETVMVGDSWLSDVRGALDAGLRAVWVNPAGTAAPDPSVLRVRALPEVVGVLGRMRG